MPLSQAPAEAREQLARVLDAPAPHVRLGRLCTPIERVPPLDVGGTQVWVKRDELSSTVYGGSKVRKLEYVLADPNFRGRHILGIGALGSHQLVALSLFHAARGGRLSTLLFNQPLRPEVEDNLATTLGHVHRSGGRVHHVRGRLGLPWAWLTHQFTGERGAYLTPGASNGLGCMGFVAAGFELAAQIRANAAPQPRRIYLAAGTAGSAAGLAIGLALCRIKTHLRLVSAVEPWAFNPLMMRLKLRMAYQELRKRGLEGPSSVHRLLAQAGVEWSVLSDAVGKGYGVPTPEGDAAVAYAAAHGLQLEATYTGKCLARMRRELELEDPGPVMFWNSHADTDLSAHVDPRWRSQLRFVLPPEAP